MKIFDDINLVRITKLWLGVSFHMPFKRLILTLQSKEKNQCSSKSVGAAAIIVQNPYPGFRGLLDAKVFAYEGQKISRWNLKRVLQESY